MQVPAASDALQTVRHKSRAAHPLKTAKGRPPRKVLLSLCGNIRQWLLLLILASGKNPESKGAPPATLVTAIKATGILLKFAGRTAQNACNSMQ